MDSNKSRKNSVNSNDDGNESLSGQHHDASSNKQHLNSGNTTKLDSPNTSKKSISAVQQCKQANIDYRSSAPALLSKNGKKKEDIYEFLPVKTNSALIENSIEWTLKTGPKKTTINDINSYFSKSKAKLKRDDTCLVENKNCKESDCVFCSIDNCESDQYILKDYIPPKELHSVTNSIMESRLNGFHFVEKIEKVYKIVCKKQAEKPDTDKRLLVYLFHGSPAEKVVSILKSGLECKETYIPEKGIYLTPSSSVAALHAAKRSQKNSKFQYVLVNSIEDYFTKKEVLIYEEDADGKSAIKNKSEIYYKRGSLKYNFKLYNENEVLHMFPKYLTARKADNMTYFGVDEIIVKKKELVNLKYLVLVKTKDPILNISKLKSYNDDDC